VPGVPQAYGLTVAQYERVLWAISPDGNTYQGAQAASSTLATLVGLLLFRFLYHCLGIRQIENKLYKWVASHRQFLPGIRPYCKRL
jgi:predicted DCC family thiol-disulfide oxidoreductase YuxK